ncbi:zinc ribbon domain-containing protein [Chachezhania antarctica]|uniref:zinc ribbon domain-containing protein n=1 Tax=Chachezhania antarctica TaxID=2340860 RepID=UPI000EB231D4|nr:zinc ribbon domain-containing protein [Chachezhania antarctica]|tara:strand:- start:7127 stop:7534 length:408 start_codon:yes stop_codon:yes gene_type:complete
MTALEKPDLYEIDGTGPALKLIFGQCAACKEQHFPHTGYGCPRCGARPEQVTPEARDGRATLLTFITLHAKLAPGITPPCVVAEAEIAPGMIEEVMLSGSAAQYRDGMTIVARAEEVERNGETVLACRFAPEEEV